MIKPIIFLLVIVICSCTNSKEMRSDHNMDINNQEDTLEYKRLSNVFYQGSDGNIYIKTRALIKPPEEYGPDFYREVPVEDVATYADLPGGYYAKDKFNVYGYRGTTDGDFITVIEEADTKSFSVISFQLGRDQNHVFYRGKIVEGIDVSSLVILCDHPHLDYISSYGLIKDDKNVYYNNSRMETIDAASFECICEDSTIVYQDKDWIYDDDYFVKMDPDMDPKKRRRRK